MTASATTCSRPAGRAIATASASRRSTSATLLRAGPNAIGVTLADGWYGERYGFGEHTRRIYGDELAVLVQLELHDADGRSTAS